MTDDPLDAPTSLGDSGDQLGARGSGLQAVLAADFAVHGPDVVKVLRLERPHDYLKLVASLVAKDSPAPHASG